MNFICSRFSQMVTILYMGKAGKLPLRTTHNVTKFNNVLLDKEDWAQCVIDLDTVMPGFVAYNFGDAICTIFNPTEDDEKELKKIDVNMKLFEAFAIGFIQEAIHELTLNEIDSLFYGCLLLPFFIGLRFLTDHIVGDIYYKFYFPDHILQRARAQFCLVEKLEERFTLMQDIITRVSNNIDTEKAL